MPSLKDLKLRIESVKSTRKITSAMKMVAAAKLKRSQEQAEQARPYAVAMQRLMSSLAMSAKTAGEELPRLLQQPENVKTTLVLVVTSDRGLCGMFNSTIYREARKQIAALKAEGQDVKVFAIGRRGRDQMRREYGKAMIGSIEDISKKRIDNAAVDYVTDELLKLFDAGAFDRCVVVYNRFKSAMTQIPTAEQLIPVPMPENTDVGGAVYEFEPDATSILADLLPRNMAMQVFRVLIETSAGFYGAQMTAMDGATRNAGDMINRLTLTYNRTRQAYITKELIEIISGAEAL